MSDIEQAEQLEHGSPLLAQWSEAVEHIEPRAELLQWAVNLTPPVLVDFLGEMLTGQPEAHLEYIQVALMALAHQGYPLDVLEADLNSRLGVSPSPEPAVSAQSPVSAQEQPVQAPVERQASVEPQTPVEQVVAPVQQAQTPQTSQQPVAASPAVVAQPLWLTGAHVNTPNTYAYHNNHQVYQGLLRAFIRKSYTDLITTRLVDVHPQGVEYGAQGAARREDPTTVRVILNRIEALTKGIVEPGQTSLLSTPERVTLVEGDEFEVYVWNSNRLATADSVVTGLGLSQGGAPVTMGQLFEGTPEFSPATGGGGRTWMLNDTLVGDVIEQDGVYFAQKLTQYIDGAGQHIREQGGFVMRGKVKAPPGGGHWTLDVQHAAAYASHVGVNAVHDPRLSQKGTEGQGAGPQGVAQVTDAQALEAYDVAHQANPDVVIAQEPLHQQGQFYGDFQGGTPVVLEEGMVEPLIAAPGSWAYHADSWASKPMAAGTNRTVDPSGRQAAYWVPIHVDLQPGANAPGHIAFQGEGGGFADPNAISIVLQDSRGTHVYEGGAFALDPNGTTRVTVIFEGTSNTALRIVTDPYRGDEAASLGLAGQQ